MAGHSKWANIKHKKAATDAKKAKQYMKISKELQVAARGNPDPETNARLSTALARARAMNMPRDNIQSALKKAAGAKEGDLIEVTYEGFGPGGVAVLVQTATDNKNRAASQIRHLFARSGGAMGGTGSVAWLFGRMGVLDIVAGEGQDSLNSEAVLETGMELGVEDFEEGTGEDGNGITLLTPADALMNIKKELEGQGYAVKEAAITFAPKGDRLELDDDAKTSMLTLLDALDDHEDVQEVYHNGTWASDDDE